MQKAAFGFGLAMLGVGLAVGGAVGFLVAPAPRPDVVLTQDRAATTGAATGGGGAAPVAPGASTRAAPPSRGGPSAASPGAGGDSSLGAITGTVLGPDDVPLAGVLIRAEPGYEDPWKPEDGTAPRLPPGSPPPRRDLDREVREYEAQLRRAEEGLREAETDSSGTYALNGLPGKGYSLSAWLVGYRIERVGGEPWEPVLVGQTCDFRATRIYTVPVSVLLPDGKAPDRAVVTWKAAGGGDEEEAADWTLAAPEIAIAPGTWEIRATAGEKGESETITIGRWRHRGRRFVEGEDDSLYSSAPLTVTIVAGKPEPLTFQLEGRPGIRVKIVYPSPGTPPRTVRIAALRLDGATSADPVQLLGGGKVRDLWLEGTAEGTIVGLEPGTYLVGATFRGGQVGPTAAVTVGAGLVTQELRVPNSEIRDWITLWVRGPDGTPVRDAAIECGCRGEGSHGSQDLDIKAEADGSYRVEHYEQDAPSFSSSWSFGGDDLGTTGRTYYVQAKSDRFGEAEATYDPVKDREVTIQLVAPAIVRATIPGFATHPDRGRAFLFLEAKEDREGRHSDHEADIDASGTAKFKPVKPGKYEVVLRLAKNETRQEMRNARWNGAEAARIPVTLGPGETTVTVPLASLVGLVVTFEGEAPDLMRVGPDGVPRHLRRGRGEATGKEVTFGDLAAGTYYLVSRTGWMLVDVPAPGTVAFRTNPFNAYYLEVTDKGYVHDLGLKTGDLVVAIDGVEFKDKKGMDAFLLMATTRESAKFTIQRSGERFDVTADPGKFESDEGSFYQPWSR